MFILLQIIFYTLIILSILYICNLIISLFTNAILKTDPGRGSEGYETGGSKDTSGSGPFPDGGPGPDAETSTGHAQEEKNNKRKTYNYHNSEKGRKVRVKAQSDYNSSEKGRKNKMRYRERLKERKEKEKREEPRFHDHFLDETEIDPEIIKDMDKIADEVAEEFGINIP